MPLLVLPSLVLVGCQSAPPPAAPRYTIGAPYQAGGGWRYPQEDYRYDATGLAVVASARRGALTADGERFDPNALAAAHPTLQLPVIARVTDLRTGRQVVLRINDRGPAERGRLLALTLRAAQLLGLAPGPARVRVQVLEAESRRAAEALGGGALVLAAAPREPVTVETLAGPGAFTPPPPPTAPPAPVQDATPAPSPPLRLPEQVTQGPPDPGRLWIAGSSFGRAAYAAGQQAQLAGLPAEVVSDSNGRVVRYRVRVGPLAGVADADAMLDRVLAAGVVDARIVVEP